MGKNTDEITVAECQIALSYLGYNHSILSEDNIRKILQVRKNQLTMLLDHLLIPYWLSSRYIAT